MDHDEPWPHESEHEPLPRVCVSYLLRAGPRGTRQVLLGLKKRGLGEGRFVGLGGKLEPGESARDAAVREIAEESGLVVEASALDRRGDLCYLFPHRRAWSQRSTVFVVSEWRGEPSPSDELDPVWFDVDRVPYDEMWDDAKRWLPGVLIGGHVSREFTFAVDLATVSGERSV